MFQSIRRKILIVGFLALTLAFRWVFVSSQSGAMPGDGAITLQPPPFVSIAHAQGGTSFADSEAGIAAYIRATSTINLAQVIPFYRTVEEQYENYILGSVGVTDYDNNHDVKVYIHRDGWIMAYYPRNEPTSRIFDWVHYNGSRRLPTKLEKVLTEIGSQVGAPISEGVNYYHFAHPNANRLMLVADSLDSGGSESFTIDLPTQFIFHENSWSHFEILDCSNCTLELKLDGATISQMKSRGEIIRNGLLSESQFSVGVPHVITILRPATGWVAMTSGGLALLYEVPQ
ncbi:hypothetical protein KFU94_44690 [Chloroflexi bacterium TSY]|nr:hypothetical protein [Chloroflexi bacterium TSY]